MEEVNNPITMAVDLKKYGIRIHKTVFRLIGEPKYIQLLVNPTARYVAIRGVEESYSRDQTHKVNKRRMETAHGYEIYCKDLMRKLCMVVGGLDEGHGYRLTGRIVPVASMTEAIEVFQKLAAAEYAPAFGTESEAASERQMRLAAHRTWLRSIPHEIPNPEHAYRVGIYIRYFNQTRYDNYLDYHIQQYRDTLAMCPDWSLVDFYIDEGATAPNMETAPEWSRLLQDALDGKVDLIITQKVSNVSKKDYEIAFVARILAALDKPVGIYFVSEDIFTLASYYRSSLRDEGFFPSEDWSILPEPEQKALSPGGEDTAYIE